MESNGEGIYPVCYDKIESLIFRRKIKDSTKFLHKKKKGGEVCILTESILWVTWRDMVWEE